MKHVLICVSILIVTIPPRTAQSNDSFASSKSILSNITKRDNNLTFCSDIHSSPWEFCFCVGKGDLDGSGRSDSLPALNGLLRRNDELPIIFEPGIYRLSKNSEERDNQIYQFIDVKVVGTTGFPSGVGDGSVFLGGLPYGWALTDDTSTINRFTTFTSLGVKPTNAKASYEKGAGYDYAATSDPSFYVGGGTSWAPLVTKDIVARQMSGSITRGNMSGRAWGAVSGCTIPAGAAGDCNAHEFDSVNQSSIDQPFDNQPTGLNGIQIVAMGSSPSTDGLVITGARARFHNGAVVHADAVLDYAYRLLSPSSLTQNYWSVDKNGNELSNSLAITTGIVTTLGSTMNFGVGGSTILSVSMKGVYSKKLISAATIAGDRLFSLSTTVVGANSAITTPGQRTLDSAKFTSSNGPVQLTAAKNNFTELGTEGSQGGGVVSLGAVYDGGAVFNNLSAMSSVKIVKMAANTDGIELTNITRLSMITIVLPPITGTAGQVFWIGTLGGVAALTVKSSSGSPVRTPSSIAQGTSKHFISDGKQWFPL